MRLREGQVFAGYTVLRKLGRGGMASIYLVTEPGFARQVALKVLPEDLADEPSFVARFQQEAQTIATLEHPTIVPLYRFGIEDGVPWMALRYIAGGDLSKRMAERPLGLAEGFTILGDIAKALDHAHKRGVIHRDLKPQNILLDEDGHAYLADFGVAKLLEATALVKTGTGSAVGTPTYMSPEQALGHELTGASDIYALGVICYQWWTGTLPFDADTPHAVLLKHAMEPLPTKPLESLSPAVVAVLTRSLEKDPKARYPTATALIDALREAQTLVPGAPQTPAAAAIPPSVPAGTPPPVPGGFNRGAVTPPPASPAASGTPPPAPASASVTPPPAATPRPALEITRPSALASRPAASSSLKWWLLGGFGGLMALVLIALAGLWLMKKATPAIPGAYSGFANGKMLVVVLSEDGTGSSQVGDDESVALSWRLQADADKPVVVIEEKGESEALKIAATDLTSGRYVSPIGYEHSSIAIRRVIPEEQPTWPETSDLPAGWLAGKVSITCDDGQAGQPGWLRFREDGRAKVRLGDTTAEVLWMASRSAEGQPVVRLTGESIGATLTAERWESSEDFAAGTCLRGALSVEVIPTEEGATVAE